MERDRAKHPDLGPHLAGTNATGRSCMRRCSRRSFNITWHWNYTLSDRDTTSSPSLWHHECEVKKKIVLALSIVRVAIVHIVRVARLITLCKRLVSMCNATAIYRISSVNRALRAAARIAQCGQTRIMRPTEPIDQTHGRPYQSNGRTSMPSFKYRRTD